LKSNKDLPKFNFRKTRKEPQKMSDLKKVINAADLDAALQNIEKSFSETKVTLEKSVDKRAMGGDQKVETGNEVISAPGDDRTGLPKVGAGTREVSKLQGNWAERYPMDAAAPGALEAAVADSAKAPTRDKEPVNKSVEQSAEPGSMSKAADADQSSESSKIVKAADASSSYSSMSKAADASDSSSSKSSKKNPFAKAVVPAEKPASETAASGAPQLKKSMKLIASAKKHLAKAYEGGSDSELDIAGDRLVEAKTTINKAITSGEAVPAELVKSLNKASKYFGKALASFENDKIEEHVKSVEKADKHMAKALNAFDFKSTSAAPIEKSVAAPEKNEIKFNHKDGKVVAEMTEEQYKQVQKALNEKGIYKSFLDTLPKEDKATIDAMPVLKSLVDGLKDSQNALRDNLVATAQKDNDFKKSVTEALNLLAKASKQNTAEVEKLKSEPQVRKSILTEVKSPLEEVKKPSIDVAQMTEILEKGIRKGICSNMTLLAWDVDKDMIGKGLLDAKDELKYVNLCEKIQRS
jgi:hypothetical protein